VKTFPDQYSFNVRVISDRQFFPNRDYRQQMRYPLFMTTLGLLSSVVMVSAQPGPITTSNSSNLVFAASTLLTNGIPGLPGLPVSLMVGSVQPSSAQGGAVSLVTGLPWVRRYNGPANNEDQAYAIVADNNGNIIVGGYSASLASGLDYVTIKYTTDGTALWTNRYDSPDHGTDRLEAMAVDGSGGVYVSGEADTNVVTIKYTSQGTPVWTNTYSAISAFLAFQGIAVDNDGNTFLLPFDIDSNSYILIKYDVNGNPAWTNFFQSLPTSMDNASAVAVDATGNIFVTGTSFDSSSGSTFLTIKYASDGSLLWTQRYSIAGLEDASRLIVDQLGNVIVVGNSQGGTSQEKHPLVKYSNDGTPLWTNIIAGPGYAGGGIPQIAADPAGNVFLVTGSPGSSAVDYTTVEYSSAGVPLWTNRFADLNGGQPALFGVGTDNAGNVYWAIESTGPSGANYNYVTLKYAPTGAAVWTNRYNGPANADDNPRAMTVDKAGGVYVTGLSSSGGTSFSAFDWATVKYADNVRYAPPPGFVGQDTVTFTAVDSFGNSAVGSVVINVLGAPPPPPNAVVAPAAYTSIGGNGGLNTLVRNTNAPRTYQMQFTPDALVGLPVGARIKALGVRAFTSTPANFPAGTVGWSDYEVTLAQAANPIASMSTTFAANLRNPVLVKSGPLSIGPNQFTAGANPNAFGTLVVLDTPYVYQGGDLMMQFTHTGSDSASTILLDTVTNGTPGYATSFRALSASTFGAASGTANAAVTIVEIMFTPTITQTIARSGNQVIINGAGGMAGATYRILGTTNVALPLAQWTPIFTNQFGAGGSFSYTNVIQPNRRSQYFRVSAP
jgi:hypothetical protein